MTERVSEDVRARVAEFLPYAIQKTCESYKKFLDDDTQTEASGFSKQQTACKVAIAHLNLLIKLAEWADLENTINTPPDLKPLLERAKEDIKNMGQMHFPEDDDGEDKT